MAVPSLRYVWCVSNIDTPTSLYAFTKSIYTSQTLISMKSYTIAGYSKTFPLATLGAGLLVLGGCDVATKHQYYPTEEGTGHAARISDTVGARGKKSV